MAIAPPFETIIHASCVAVNDRAVLITGAAGQGKTTLALALMAHGAILVADDRVMLSNCDGRLVATAPPTIAGLIEARGIGLLNAAHADAASVAALIDLDQTETDRIPPPRYVTQLGCDIPLFFAVTGPHFAAAIMQFLKAGLSQR